MRFIDELLCEPVAKMTTFWLERLVGSVVVAADNVQDHLVEQERLPHLEELAQRYPWALPPAPLLFVESRHRLPGGLWRQDKTTGEWHGILSHPHRWGILLESTDLAGRRQTQAARYDVTACLFGSWEGYGTQQLMYWDYQVTEDGYMAPEGVRPCDALNEALWASDEARVDASDFYAYELAVALMSVSLMHCKNVQQRVVEHPERLQRAATKRRGRPLVSYRVLVVDPQRPGAKPAGLRPRDTAGDAPPRALHICRGNFADYSEGAGLFGRLHGRYWRPMHVRGQTSSGLALKDYRVLPAPEQGD